MVRMVSVIICVLLLTICTLIPFIVYGCGNIDTW